MGGSLIFGAKKDTNFIMGVRDILIKYKEDYNFAIVCGGGKTAREYSSFAKELGLSEKAQDLLGIDATRLNAKLLLFVLNNLTTGKIYTSISELVRDFGSKITLCGGMVPGQRTDKVAALIAKELKIKTLINLTNVDGVYDKDPNKYPDAKLIPILDYKKFYQIANLKKHVPSYHFVFDFDASEICHKESIKVVIINGQNLMNLDKFLNNAEFIGSIIEF